MDEAPITPPRKQGRPKRGNLVKQFTIMLPPELHEWAMQHREGFSGLVRRLLAEERIREATPAPPSPTPPSRASTGRHRSRKP